MATYNGTGQGLTYTGTAYNDVFNSNGNNIFYGGLGVDTFNCLFGTTTIQDLGYGGTDILKINAGALANVKLAGNWVASSLTANNSSASAVDIQTNGYSVNLSAVTDGYGYKVTNVGVGATIIGSKYSDVLVGSSGNDTIYGGIGGDVITSGGGVDILTGGKEADGFIVNARIASITDFGNNDSIYVYSGATANANYIGGGFTVQSNNGILNISTGSNVDLSSATGSGTYSITSTQSYVTSGIFITGSLNSDVIYGGAGHDYLYGGKGNDTINGGLGSDNIYGGIGNDVLYGGADDYRTFADSFWIESGTDSVMDLGGNDRVIVSSGAAVNAFITSAWSGSPSFLSSGTNSGTANFYTSGTNVNLVDFINNGKLTLTNTGGGATLYGTLKDDTIVGGVGNDTIYGNNGNDILNGGAGNDTYIEGSGVDTYVITSGIDTIDKIGIGVYDNVQVSSGAVLYTKMYDNNFTSQKNSWIPTSSSYNNGTVYLGSNGIAVNLSAITSGANGYNVLNSGNGTTLTGSDLNDYISGGAFNDIINGRSGSDQLTGGAGADHFVFNTALNASKNVDTITDFTARSDKIDLSKSVMKALGTVGTLKAAQFWSNTTGLAHDADDRIIYNSTTGGVYYDADGTGVLAGTKIAIIGTVTHPAAMTNTDFLVIA